MAACALSACLNSSRANQPRAPSGARSSYMQDVKYFSRKGRVLEIVTRDELSVAPQFLQKAGLFEVVKLGVDLRAVRSTDRPICGEEELTDFEAIKDALKKTMSIAAVYLDEDGAQNCPNLHQNVDDMKASETQLQETGATQLELEQAELRSDCSSLNLDLNLQEGATLRMQGVLEKLTQYPELQIQKQELVHRATKQMLGTKRNDIRGCFVSKPIKITN